MFNIYLPVYDILAFTVFIVGWVSYSIYADQTAKSQRPVAVVIDDYRLRWMERMLERKNRMPDVNIAVSFVRVSMMFASTFILFLAGSLAMLGQVDNVREIIACLAHAHPASRILMEIQLFILMAIFVYAFFKFIWAIRLFDNMLILLGAAPQNIDCDETIKREYPKYMAQVANRANFNLNRGQRAYIFGLGLLPWFLHPLLLVASTIVVIAVLYRRDFCLVSLRALEDLRAHHEVR
jgi:uncharacterized membrane protein